MRKSSAAGAAALAAWLASCAVPTDSEPEPVGTLSQSIHSSHAGPAPWKHVLTCYGGCAAPHYDPSACNHATSCGPIANGKWWYATERAAFHCGAKLKLVRGNRCVVVDVEDNGPADWVEDNAASQCGTPYIIDASPLVADYFGGGCGWGECFLVDVSPVPDNTPTGPDGCISCDCQPGQQQEQGCGNCGTRARTCGSDCHWNAWSQCAGQGPCAPSEQQSRSCCDCGSQTRTCNHQCAWGPWSDCAGPDPAGGTQPCETGERGACAEGRARCRQGCLSCVRLHDPQPERCDEQDNDCDGNVDNGNPSQMGDPPPHWAAQLEDYSFRLQLRPGELEQVWAEFRNVGSSTWPRGQVWLASMSGLRGEPSALYAEAHWPAWDIAGVLEQDVAPGASGFVAFYVKAPAGAQPEAADEFRLMGPDGTMMACPTPSVEVAVSVTAPGASVSEPDALPAQDPAGCACRSSGAAVAPASAWLLGFAAWSIMRARRRRIGLRDGEGSKRHG